MELLNKTKSFFNSASDTVTDFIKDTSDKSQEKLHQATELFSDIEITNTISEWISSLFISALESCSTEKDRLDLIAWLAMSREVLLEDNLTVIKKTELLYQLFDSKSFAKGFFRSIEEGFENYKKANLPLAIKIAIPITLSASAIVGGAGIGMAGFGTAIGVPVLLVIFLGAAGITSVLESFLTNSEARDYISVISAIIAKDELLRRANQKMRQAMSENIDAPKQYHYTPEKEAITTMLLEMDAYDFEKHVMSFFQQVGLLAWVTKKSNDAGVDGFARHINGLVIVQCKRNAANNAVGRPIIQQFKGVIEENEAWRGYVVTTSYFTNEAIESAAKNDKIILIDMSELINWHVNGIQLNP
jgi:restriction system protein